MEHKKIAVYYAKCASYDPAELRTALKKVIAPQIEEFGGVSGKKILLKPNWLAYRKANDIAAVHPAVSVEAAKLFLDAGAKKVSLMENPAVQTAPSIAKSMGMADEFERLGVEVHNFTDYARIPVVEGVRFQHIDAAREYMEFDAMVNIAKAKTHAMMTLTLCVKNLFGLVKGSERMGWHLAVGKDFPMFADMLLDMYLVMRPQFNILDAVTCMEGNGPGSGDPTERNFVAGSSDALALDASVSPLFGEDNLLLVRRAVERQILPQFEEMGEIPEKKPFVLPDPPGIFAKWGCPLPPFMENILRKVVISKPILKKDLCIGCRLCEKMCPPQSLKMVKGYPVFDLKNCIRCYCCQEHCPKGAIHSKKTFPMKVADTVENGIRALFGTGKKDKSGTKK